MNPLPRLPLFLRQDQQDSHDLFHLRWIAFHHFHPENDEEKTDPVNLACPACPVQFFAEDERSEFNWGRFGKSYWGGSKSSYALQNCFAITNHKSTISVP